MTPTHALIIIAGVFAPVLCGLSHECASSMPAVMQLASAAVVGALANAGVTNRRGRRKLLARKAERATNG